MCDSVGLVLDIVCLPHQCSAAIDHVSDLLYYFQFADAQVGDVFTWIDFIGVVCLFYVWHNIILFLWHLTLWDDLENW